jgi:glycyl-tRNA synthetase beta chain
MTELLLELLTEEIPARMQATAAADLLRLVTGKLTSAGLAFGDARAFVTPRRLTLVIDGLPAATPDMTEERRGPRVGAPDAAVQGFLKSAGIASLADCEPRDTGKGIFYFAIIGRKGQATAQLLPSVIQAAMLELPWPKSMRFPAASFRWVRPLVSVVSLFGGEVLPLSLGNVPVGDATRGHRFLSDGPIRVRDFADYRDKLRGAHVLLEASKRRGIIASSLTKAAATAGYTIKDDQGLLDEVTGLVEWPVVLLGGIDPAFMDLPPEVLTTSMRSHQKYFACLDSAGRLAPRFVLVANMAADDGGREIVAGNERVLRARLSDARFFWEQDRKHTLASRVPKLAERVFHAKLGSVLQKVERIKRLVEIISPLVEADLASSLRAAELAKADLSTGMVGEFPELQGVMGRYYALHDGVAPEIAQAIAEHYSPLGPNDRCPTAPISVAVALADKIDTLVGFFAVGEVPTGSRDPFALRRAALGIIRLILENNLRLPLQGVLSQGFKIAQGAGLSAMAADPTDALLAFFADRLKVHLRERGTRHDLVAAIFALGGEDDFVRLIARVAALDAFLASDDGANLLTAFRRASNIVRIEEKKDGIAYAGEADPARLVLSQETALSTRLAEVAMASADALAREAFAQAMTELAKLSGPVDEFFAEVTVNCEDVALRANRLRLLAQIRDTLNRVADFSQIEG